MRLGCHSAIDWSATGSWMQAWATFAGAAAVLIAAWIGSARFSEWLRQQQTTRQMDAGERVLTLVYRLKRTFHSVRSSGVSGGELARAEAKLTADYPGYGGLRADHQRRLKTSQVVLTRIAGSEAEWTEFFAVLPIAKAYFGDDVELHLDRLWKQHVAVQVSAEMYGDPNVTRDEARDYEADFWEGHGGTRKARDKVGAEIASAVSDIEVRLLPLLRSEMIGSKK